MKFTLCAIGSWGDVAPFISLGRALLERGSDVVLASPPEFAAAAASAGLEFRPVAPTCTPVVEAASATTGAQLSAIPLLLRATRVLTEETLGELPSIADGSQLLVATGIVYAAPHVAEALGIAYRAVTPCPRWYPSEHHPPAIDRAHSRPKFINSAAWWATKWNTDRTLYRLVNRWRRRQGLSPAADLYTRMLGLPGQRLLAADEELAPLPADVEGTRRVSAIGAFQADSLPEYLEDFLASGDRPVYIGFGSMRATDADRLLDVVFESAAALNVRTIVPDKWVQATGRGTPDGCIAVGHVAHSRLFPRLAAVVHHGGAGTTTTAARAGVPQVVIPHVMDQHYWGYRVHELGIGPAPLDYKRLSPRTLTAALRQSIGPSVAAEKARAFACHVDGREGVVELADLLRDDLPFARQGGYPL
jgi:vancomycin aglycone glucosyltransferase